MGFVMASWLAGTSIRLYIGRFCKILPCYIRSGDTAMQALKQRLLKCYWVNTKIFILEVNMTSKQWGMRF